MVIYPGVSWWYFESSRHNQLSYTCHILCLLTLQYKYSNCMPQVLPGWERRQILFQAYFGNMRDNWNFFPISGPDYIFPEDIDIKWSMYTAWMGSCTQQVKDRLPLLQDAYNTVISHYNQHTENRKFVEFYTLREIDKPFSVWPVMHSQENGVLIRNLGITAIIIVKLDRAISY